MWKKSLAIISGLLIADGAFQGLFRFLDWIGRGEVARDILASHWIGVVLANPFAIFAAIFAGIWFLFTASKNGSELPPTIYEGSGHPHVSKPRKIRVGWIGVGALSIGVIAALLF
jgi:hypothetical protein